MQLCSVFAGGAVLIFRILNALGGLACILVGVFLARLDFIFVHQAQGSDAFTLIQAHWIAVGVISILISRSSSGGQFLASLLLVWLFLNGWLGGKALLVGDPRFSWVLVFPVLAFLNFFQFLAQDELSESGDELQEVEATPLAHEPGVPADYYELSSTSPAVMVKGVLLIVLVVALQIAAMAFFFFYGTLLVRVIFEGASIDFTQVSDAFGGAIWKILYIPVIIAAVYSIVFLVQIVIEKAAIGGGSSNGEDVNRPLSLEERTFIERTLSGIGSYISETKFPPFYSWLYWPSIIAMIGTFIGLPVLVVAFEYMFFDPVALSGVPEGSVITALGPALIGGVVFSFLFGSMCFWAFVHWMGARYRSFGEYLHMRWGWNSMNSEPRPLESYAKILTRFVRKRRYSPDRAVEPREFIHNAYDEFNGIIYKSTIALGIATVLFTALDVNWRRVTHTGGMHYSPYFDFRSHDLALDDIVGVQLRCFLYNENDGGERNPGVGYDVIFSNGLYGYLLDGDLDNELLDKVESIDSQLRSRDLQFTKAQHAGPVILRTIDGYWSDCAETVLPKLEADIRPRVAALIRARSGESSLEN